MHPPLNGMDYLEVLDRDLPSVHGDDVCRELVAGHPDVRVLMLTAAADVLNRVAGPVLGSADYLGKPFDPQQLIESAKQMLATRA